VVFADLPQEGYATGFSSSAGTRPENLLLRHPLAAVLSGSVITHRDEAVHLTDGQSYADAADLTRASKAMAHMHIVSAGRPYLIPFDDASTVVSPRPADNGPKGQAGAQLSSIRGATNIDKGILKTDFTLRCSTTSAARNSRRWIALS